MVSVEFMERFCYRDCMQVRIKLFDSSHTEHKNIRHTHTQCAN